MNLPLPEAKRRQRALLKAALQELSPSQRQVESAAILHQLTFQHFWENARSILFYLPTAHEPDILSLLRTALASGRTVCLPRFDAEDGRYHAAVIRNLDQDLQLGRFGIREPSPACPGGDEGHLDLSLVPGLGFSPDGVRLGRGLGYYDRLLATTSGVRCGVAFGCQLKVVLPTEPHDILMHYIVTPERCLNCPPRMVDS